MANTFYTQRHTSTNPQPLPPSRFAPTQPNVQTSSWSGPNFHFSVTTMNHGSTGSLNSGSSYRTEIRQPRTSYRSNDNVARSQFGQFEAPDSPFQNRFQQPHEPLYERGGGGLFNDLLQNILGGARVSAAEPQSARSVYEADDDGESDVQFRSRSSRLTDKLHRKRYHEAESTGSGRSRVRPDTSRRRTRPAPAPVVEATSSSSENEEDDDKEQQHPQNSYQQSRGSAAPIDEIRQLQYNVHQGQDRVNFVRSRLQHASSDSSLSSGHWQYLVDELRSAELASKEDLRRLQATQQAQSRRQTRLPRRATTQSSPSTQNVDGWSNGRFGFFQQHNATPSLMTDDFPFQRFEDFVFLNPFPSMGQMLGEDDDLETHLPSIDPFGFLHAGLGMHPEFARSQSYKTEHRRPPPPRSETFSGFAGTRSRPRHEHDWTARQPPPKTVSFAEAKALFETYKDSWAALSPSDVNVPYPSSTLGAQALLDYSTIYAPAIRTPPREWSPDMIIEANTQAFYLRACGLQPTYSENPGSGQLVMGFDKAKAGDAQVKSLIDVLKKERVRWHSDRLGRRNGGNGGVNEALQKSVEARSVFHGARELMELALQ